MKTNWQFSLRSFLLICAATTLLLVLIWPNSKGMADGGGPQRITVDSGILPISELKIVPIRPSEDLAAVSTAMKSSDPIKIFSLVEPYRITTITNPSDKSIVNVQQGWSFTFHGSFHQRTSYQQKYSHALVVAVCENGEKLIHSVTLPDYCRPITVQMKIESR